MISRRELIIGAGLATGAALPVARGQAALPGSGAPDRALLHRALGAIRQYRGRLGAVDRIGIVDFSQASRIARFFLLDLNTGASRAVLVAHGRGSDPAHSGWLERFSNEPGSLASSAGAYVTGATYEGKHGRSCRLVGLDPQNSNAESRAIVVHAASYVNDAMARERGKIGRSEGCFALARESLGPVLSHLGNGRLIYADRLIA
ncbi:MAG: murein L,D-transpeptidase catalytic domain family protein [Sphingomonas sp.]